eukprot:2156968-Pyramimonas_sp.AAC.1
MGQSFFCQRSWPGAWMPQASCFTRGDGLHRGSFRSDLRWLTRAWMPGREYGPHVAFRKCRGLVWSKPGATSSYGDTATTSTQDVRTQLSDCTYQQTPSSIRRDF